ncbi:hypothetical protein BJX62DRAFT_20577 [Aspergillus germanicus]
MTDTGAHQGVKSLLARFENSQQKVASPPPRDRSPAGSESLSKVRASFIAVEGGTPSSPVLGLRRVDGITDSPLPPPRMKSFGSEDLDGSVKSNGSPPPPTNGLGSAPKVNESEKKEIVAETVDTKGKQKVVEEVSSATKENQPIAKPTTPAPGLSATRPARTVAKKPSNVHISKAASTTKPASQAPSSKAPGQPRTPTSASKPDSEKPTRATRTSRPSTTTTLKPDAPKAPVHKPSRTSLATAAKTSTRPSRSSTPAREVAKSTTRSSDVRSSSTARPARLPASITAPNLSSSRLSTTGGTTSTLTRKPSSLKGATATTRQRAITPTASSVRKQPSRSPPQSGDRSSSRMSTTKPVDESFLARMMRPTASSANKAHEKIEVKSPPRAKVTRAPRRVPSKLDTRSNRPTKDRASLVSPQEPKKEPQPVAEPAETRPREVEPEIEPVQEVAEQSTPEVSEQSSSRSLEPAIEIEEPREEPAVESLAESAAEPTSEPATHPADTHDAEPKDASPTQPEETVTESPSEPTVSLGPEDKVESVETLDEPSPEAPAAQGSTLAEPAADQTTEAAKPDVEDVETVKFTEPEVVPVPQETEPEAPVKAPLEIEATTTETKSDEVDIDLSKLTLSDKDASN